LRGLIVFLLSDSAFTPEECRLVGAGDQPAHFGQRRKIDARRSNGHAAACHRINHPSRNRDHDTCRSHDLEKTARRSFFHATNGNLLAEIRMPTVIDLNFIADMGRMNGALQLPERIASSPAAMAVEGHGQQSPRSFRQRK